MSAKKRRDPFANPKSFAFNESRVDTTRAYTTFKTKYNLEETVLEPFDFQTDTYTQSEIEWLHTHDLLTVDNLTIIKKRVLHETVYCLLSPFPSLDSMLIILRRIDRDAYSTAYSRALTLEQDQNRGDNFAARKLVHKVIRARLARHYGTIIETYLRPTALEMCTPFIFSHFFNFKWIIRQQLLKPYTVFQFKGNKVECSYRKDIVEFVEEFEKLHTDIRLQRPYPMDHLVEFTSKLHTLRKHTAIAHNIDELNRLIEPLRAYAKENRFMHLRDNTIYNQCEAAVSGFYLADYDSFRRATIDSAPHPDE